MSDIYKNYNAYIFDLDGTLIDSMWIWKDIDIIFLRERNIEMPDDLQRCIEGMSFNETAYYFKDRFALPESIDVIKEIWNNMAFNRYANEVKLKNGVYEFVTELKRRNKKTGIATSNSRSLTECCLSNNGILNLFDTIVTGCEITKGKPAPDIYLTAAGKLNVDASECLVFEDIPMGILAGKNAGMTVCAVYDSFSEHLNDEKKKYSDYYITDFTKAGGLYEII